MSITPEQLAKLEKMHADVAISAVAEIFQHFPEIAKALREARAEAQHWARDAEFWKAQDFEHLRQLNEARAEIELLRAAARQVHALTGWSVDSAAAIALRDIREITKGMVE